MFKETKTRKCDTEWFIVVTKRNGLIVTEEGIHLLFKE